MRVRRQDSAGDYVFGGNQHAFWVNQAEAVGQIISTRLMLYQGEWYLDTSDGTPWATQILGKYTDSTRDPVIQGRVLGSPNVQDIAGYNSQVLSPSRIFNAAMSVTTSFGTVAINAQLPATGPSVPTTEYLTIADQSPTSVTVSWSTEPRFTLNHPITGVLDSSTVVG